MGEHDKRDGDGPGTGGESLLDQLRAWVGTAMPGHENAVLWGIAGLAIALILLFVGFWQFLVIMLFVVAGVSFGQYLDGDPKIMSTIRGWLETLRKG